jgi:hypothetical protein
MLVRLLNSIAGFFQLLFEFLTIVIKSKSNRTTSSSGGYRRRIRLKGGELSREALIFYPGRRLKVAPFDTSNLFRPQSCSKIIIREGHCA